MALHSEAAFKKDLPANYDGLFDWDYLNVAFRAATGRNIQFQDIDGDVEIGGHKLKVEKKAHGAKFQAGQLQSLFTDHKYGYVTLILMTVDDSGNPVKAMIFRERTGESVNFTDTNREHMFEVVLSWASWAERNPTKTQKVNGKIIETAINSWFYG